MSLLNIVIKDVEGGIIVHLLTRIAEALERIAPIPAELPKEEEGTEQGITIASDERLLEIETEQDEKVMRAMRARWGNKLQRSLTDEEKRRWAEIEEEQAADRD